MGLFLQLEIHGAGGIEAITSDRYWRSSTGAIGSASLYDGERFDFGRAEQHWSEGDFDDDMWEPVDVLEFDVSVLHAPKGPPIRRCETLAPASITGAPNDGRYLVDFGKTSLASVRLSTDGMGSTVTIRHTEVLEHGELCTRPLRTADATDVVTFGHGRQSYEPRYTLHGFRYAGGSRPPGPLHPSAIEAVACHTDLERVGWFSCSNELVNRLHENVVWGIRSNFVGVPTDCPQRDERLGWTAISRSSLPRRPSCTTAPACSHRGSRICRPNRIPTGSFHWWCLMSWAIALRWQPGATRLSSCR